MCTPGTLPLDPPLIKTSMKYGYTPEEYVSTPEKFREMSTFSCRVQHVPFLVVILTVEGNVNFLTAIMLSSMTTTEL